MSKNQLETLKIIGLEKRTSNDAGKGEVDIPTLWGTFMGGNTMARIPNLAGQEVYAIYTEYEGDHTQPYTFILGCKVDSLDEIPEGMRGIEIPAATYEKHIAKGNINQGMVFNAWTDIWKSDLDRAYLADFEVYGMKASNPEDAEVDIFVSLK